MHSQPKAARSRLAFVAMLLVAALSIGTIAAASTLALSKHGPTSSHGPDFSTMSMETRQAYDLAPTHGDLFSHIPCYCGCAVLVPPHRDLVDCFFEAPGVYGTHAAGCVTCVDIALAAAAAQQEGLDHAQIRALIDEQFSARGPGTATPNP